MKKSLILVGLLSIGYTHAQQNDPYDGKVGINTETPAATLNVKSKTGGLTTATKNLQLESSDGTKLLTVLNNGNLGIRVDSPDDHMNIRNQIRFNWERRALGVGIAAGASSWNRGYNFTTIDGAMNFGGFSAYGDNNALNYFFIGQDYRYPIIKFDAMTKNVGIGINGYNVAPADKLHIAEGNVRITSLPNNGGSDTDKIVVVDNDGVLKSVDRININNNPSAEQEWIYDTASSRINLRRSGDVAGTFKNKIFYDANTGQYVDIDDENNIRGVELRVVSGNVGFEETKGTLSKDIKYKNYVHSESANLHASITRGASGTETTYKQLESKNIVVTNTDNTKRIQTGTSGISILSDNANDYLAVYGNGSGTSLFGTGEIDASLGQSGQVTIGNSQRVKQYITGFLGTSAVATSGTIGEVYGVYGRNFFYSPIGATVNSAAGGRFTNAMPLNDNSLIQEFMGISTAVSNNSKNTGTGRFIAGIYNIATQRGKTKYPNQYGIFTNSSVAKDAVAPDNHFGLYIHNVQGGLKTNYAIYTQTGQVRFGDLKGVGDRAVYVDANGVLKAGASGTGLGTTGLWKREGDEVKLAVLSDGTDRTQENTVAINDKGEIYATSLKGKNGASIFPDYVFQKYYTGTSSIKADYTFKSLSQVEDFVKSNGHLPGYKSAAAIKAQGYIDVMETQVANVEKIEELYLHTIEQEKALKEKDAKIRSLEERLERLEKLIK